MSKKNQAFSRSPSSIDSLKLSSFNFFGMGAVLAAVTQAFWINFSAYYLNNLIPQYGNIIFLLSQIFQGFGILLGWFILSKLLNKQTNLGNKDIKSSQQNTNGHFSLHQNLSRVNSHILLYIVGVILLVFCFPLIFLYELATPRYTCTFAILSKIGSGLMIISHFSMVPKITLNKSRRKKLVQKIIQFGLGSIFLCMFLMVIVSASSNFVWKYFFGSCLFVLLGSVFSIIFVVKIRSIMPSQARYIPNDIMNPSINQDNKKETIKESNSIVWIKLLKQPRFYIYALLLILSTLYMDVALIVYPYFFKQFRNISHIKYLQTISGLYLASFIASIIQKNHFILTNGRFLISIGFIISICSSTLLILGITQKYLDAWVIAGSCLMGFAKVIAVNNIYNMITEYIGKHIFGKEFVYGVYLFLEKIISGIILYLISRKVYLDQNIEVVHFSCIYLPLIIYSSIWIFTIAQRTCSEKLNKSHHIQIVEPEKKEKQKIVKEQIVETYGFSH